MMSLYFFLVSFILLFFVRQNSEPTPVSHVSQEAKQHVIQTYSFTSASLPPPVDLEEYRRSELRKAYKVWIENCNQINQLKRSV